MANKTLTTLLAAATLWVNTFAFEFTADDDMRIQKSSINTDLEKIAKEYVSVDLYLSKEDPKETQTIWNNQKCKYAFLEREKI